MTPILTTPDRLILRARPWVLGLGLIAGMLIFAAIALQELLDGRPTEAAKLSLLLGAFFLCFAVFVRQEVAVFDRPSGLVAIRSATIFGQREVTHSLSGLIEARVETWPGASSSSGRPTRRPVLVFPKGKILPLSQVYRSGPGAADAARAINAWRKRQKA
jgi:hypothetical protein